MTEIKAKAKLRNLRVAPRKVRQTVGPLRGLAVNEALAQLEVMNTRSAPSISKLIRSASSNARNKNLGAEKLFIASIKVDEGPTLKRSLPGARGRATLVRKKWSHVTVELGEAERGGTRFIIPETPKKIKTDRGHTPRRKAAPKKPEESTKEKGAKRGFVRKVFSRRKTI